MAEIKVTLPTPHPAQQKVLSQSSRFNVVAMGEQGGKTALGVEALLVGDKGALRGFPTAWFAETEADLVEVKRHVLRVVDGAIRRRPNARRVELTSGGLIDFFAMDDPKLQTFEQYATVVVDDPARVDGFMDLWEDVILPTLRQHTGQAWLLSVPFGKNNHFYRLFKMGQTDPDWSSWQFSSFSNPHLPRSLREEAEKVTEPERLQRFEAEFLDVAIELTDTMRIIEPGERFVDWCERLEREGLQVDGHPFTLSDRPAMRFIYEMIPSTVEEALQRVDVIMKCTQVGFTVMEMLAMIYLALKFAPAKIGMFLPSVPLAGTKSTDRFMPIVRTIPAVYRLMTDRHATGGRGGEGNVLTRNLGPSKFHFLWTSGGTSTESNPMDIVSFDEVQEMKIADMEKTRERLSASKIKYTLMGSTANWPDEDIHHWFKRGTQHQFWTRCPGCGTHQVLDEHFPDCIGYDPQAPRMNMRDRAAGLVGEYRYRCHACGGWIDDPQDGEWRAKVPDASIRSVHFPQFLSPTISPREIIEAYNTADDMKNFYNRKLGKPYTDPSQVPVNMEILNDCARLGMEAGLEWKQRARGTFMGIDQMGNFNVAIIKERMPDGRQAVVHLEYIYTTQTPENPDASPFDRCDELMAQYGVQVCVIETLPNYNDAKRFAQRHPGKVFLANYADIKDEMLRWGDGPKLDVSERRTSEEERDRYTVTLDQYKCMQVSMARFVKRLCLFPDPAALVQEVVEKGMRQTVAVCKDLAFLHFTKTALVAEKDDEQKKYRRKVVKVGIDPHTSYANMLCDVAWARAHGTSMFVMPEVEKVSVRREVVGEAMPGLPEPVLQMVEDLPEGEICGRCVSFNEETRMCGERRMLVRPRDPGCFMFVERGA